VSATAQQMLGVVCSQIGYREGRSRSGDWNNDTKYGRWYGLNGQAWCAMFISWCAAQVGASDIIPRFAYTPAGAQWFRSRGLYGNTPKVGAIGFLHSSTLGRIHHTFFVEAVHADGTFTTIEGNTNTNGSAQGDGVYRLRRRVSSVYTFGYPDYRTAPRVSLHRLRLAAGAGNHLQAPAATRRVQAALRAEGTLRGGYLPGRYGAKTRRAAAAFQRSTPGGRVPHADGMPDRAWLRRLGRRHNFTVV
jgi:hypothetical protein